MIKKIRYLLFVIPLLVCVLFVAFQRVEGSKPKVIIRFDDYGVWCNEDWLQIEEQIIDLHNKYNVKLSFGVIPDSRYPLIRHTLSPQSYPVSVEGIYENPFPLKAESRRVEVLKESAQLGITEIALHGYYHPKGYSNVGKNTEFYNVSYDIQYFKLFEGKKLLDSLFNVNVTTFIPPHNTYDKLTLDLLQEFGFKTVSAKQNGYDAPCDNRLSIRSIWQTSASIQEFETILRRPHFKNDPVQVLALHHTNFTSDGILDTNKINSYKRLLAYISENDIPSYSFSGFPDEEIVNNEYYRKVTYQYFANILGSKWASKINKAGDEINVVFLVILFYIALILAIIGIILKALSLTKLRFRKWMRFISIIMCVVLCFTLISLIIQALPVSLFELYYIILSKKFVVITIMMSLFSTLSLVRVDSMS